MQRMLLLCALIVVFPLVVGVSGVAQDSLVRELPLEPNTLGDDWSVLEERFERGGDGSVLTKGLGAAYVGPSGGRIFVYALHVAEGPAAARESWEFANSFFDEMRAEVSYDFGRERDLENEALLAGCADMRRLDGTDALLPEIQFGMTLCAADPDLIVFAYVSGEIHNLGGYAASDHVVGLVVDDARPEFPTGVSVQPPDTRATPTTSAMELCTTGTGGSETDLSLTVQTTPLIDLLPSQAQMPTGFILTAEAERSKVEVAESLGHTDQGLQLLDDWGWSGNAFRDFVADDTEVAQRGATFVNVSVHRFADTESAEDALRMFSDQVIFAQGLHEAQSEALDDCARLLVGAPDGNALAVLYIQHGPIIFRIGGSANNPDSNPSADVLSVARTTVPQTETTRSSAQVQPANGPTAPDESISVATDSTVVTTSTPASPTTVATPNSVDGFQPTHRVVSTQSVHLRSGPSWRDAMIIALGPTTPLQFLDEHERTATPKDGPRWLKFRTEDGRIGWLREIDTKSHDPVPQSGTAQPTITALETIEAAAQATIVAQSVRIAELELQQVNVQAIATALAAVAADSVLDPNQQSLTIGTDLGGILGNDQDALDEARNALSTELSRYPIGCRAGFVLISGNAPTIEQGIELAERIEALLREFWPDIFTEATGSEQFALPNVQPFGEVTADIFFYSGCEPIGR